MTAFAALFLVCTAPIAAGQAGGPEPGNAAMREIVVRWNAEWGRARVALDTATLERMLPANYTAAVGGATMSREEFMAVAKSPPPEIHLTRFDSRVLTIQPDSTGWIATIQEKLEFTRKSDDGTLDRRAALWIIKDRWEKVNGQWMPVFGEVVGNETWRNGARPPFADWAGR
jgi:hypothetical protein